MFLRVGSSRELHWNDVYQTTSPGSMYGMLPVVELVVEYSELIEPEQSISAEGWSLFSRVAEPLSRTPASVP